MKASQLIKKLSSIINRNGDAEVSFDTEAGNFNIHMVDIDACYYLKKEVIGHPLIYLISKEPRQHLRDPILISKPARVKDIRPGWYFLCSVAKSKITDVMFCNRESTYDTQKNKSSRISTKLFLDNYVNSGKFCLIEIVQLDNYYIKKFCDVLKNNKLSLKKSS